MRARIQAGGDGHGYHGQVLLVVGGCRQFPSRQGPHPPTKVLAANACCIWGCIWLGPYTTSVSELLSFRVSPPPLAAIHEDGDGVQKRYKDSSNNGHPDHDFAVNYHLQSCIQGLSRGCQIKISRLSLRKSLGKPLSRALGKSIQIQRGTRCVWAFFHGCIEGISEGIALYLDRWDARNCFAEGNLFWSTLVDRAVSRCGVLLGGGVLAGGFGRHDSMGRGGARPHVPTR